MAFKRAGREMKAELKTRGSANSSAPLAMLTPKMHLKNKAAETRVPLLEQAMYQKCRSRQGFPFLTG